MHQHEHHKGTKNLRLAFFLNLIFTLVEIVGGIYTNSIAILSDAVHDLGDSLSLGTAWYLQRKSNQKADEQYTFGYRRFSLLGALINGVVLLVGSIYIIFEAVQRIMEPETADPEGMFLFAIFGILVNGYAAWKLSSGHSMNEKMMSWHLIEDVLGWTAILIVSVILYFKEIPILDPLLSLMITLYILWNVFKRLRETIHLFLQGNPADIDRAALLDQLSKVEGVESIHDIRIWSLDGEHHVFSGHFVIPTAENNEEIIQIKRSIRKVLEAYPFEFHTIETELKNE
jgi:cobalt-zinc-cadmium efflux system protein